MYHTKIHLCGTHSSARPAVNPVLYGVPYVGLPGEQGGRSGSAPGSYAAVESRRRSASSSARATRREQASATIRRRRPDRSSLLFWVDRSGRRVGASVIGRPSRSVPQRHTKRRIPDSDGPLKVLWPVLAAAAAVRPPKRMILSAVVAAITKIDELGCNN